VISSHSVVGASLALIVDRQRMLVRGADANGLLNTACGVALTHLSGIAARCSRDMVVRISAQARKAAAQGGLSHSLRMNACGFCHP
jgi:hypothetical protein